MNGFHVLVIEEFRVMEEGEECDVTTLLQQYRL